MIEKYDEATKNKLLNGNYAKLLDETMQDIKQRDKGRYILYKEYCLLCLKRGRQCVSILDKLMDISGKEVLDFGCGHGGFSVAFAEAGAKVTGIDANNNNLKMAKLLAEDIGVNVNFIFDEEYCNSFLSNSYDIIICNDVIEHVDSFKRLAQSHSRLLKDNGLLYLVAPNRFSILNFFSDGHFNLVGPSLMSRRMGELYIVKMRKIEKNYSVNRHLGWHEIWRLYNNVGINLHCYSNQQKKTSILKNESPSTIKKIITKFLPLYISIYLYSAIWARSWIFIGRKVKKNLS